MPKVHNHMVLTLENHPSKNLNLIHTYPNNYLPLVSLLSGYTRLILFARKIYNAVFQYIGSCLVGRPRPKEGDGVSAVEGC